MTLVFTTKARNNGVTTHKGGSPFKPANMTQGSVLTNASMVYSKKGGGGQHWHDSSTYIEQKKRIAIGKNKNRVGLSEGDKSSYKSTENNSRKSALSRVRGGGAVVPKKKTAKKR
jgi:hypothetical protein